MARNKLGLLLLCIRCLSFRMCWTLKRSCFLMEVDFASRFLHCHPLCGSFPTSFSMEWLPRMMSLVALLAAKRCQFASQQNNRASQRPLALPPVKQMSQRSSLLDFQRSPPATTVSSMMAPKDRCLSNALSHSQPLIRLFKRMVCALSFHFSCAFWHIVVNGSEKLAEPPAAPDCSAQVAKMVNGVGSLCLGKLDGSFRTLSVAHFCCFVCVVSSLFCFR